MDAHTEVHLTRGDTSQNILAPSSLMDQEHEMGNAASNEYLTPDNPTLSSPDMHLSLVPDVAHIEAHQEQSPIHNFVSDEEHSDILPELNRSDDDICIYPQDSFDQTTHSAIPVVPPPECVLAGRTTSLTDINDAGTTPVDLQDSPSLRVTIVSSETYSRDEKGADPDDSLNSVQILHTELNHMGLARLTDEEETREIFDCPCEDFTCSIPPSSSPPQVFSSSPYVSSQSSAGDAEPSKKMLPAEAEPCANSHDDAVSDMVLVSQGDSRLQSEDFHGRESAEGATSPEPDEYYSQTSPRTSCIGDGLELSSKRSADRAELHGSQPIKRSKLGPHPYLPPAPKRATLVSQKRQFKKLAAPFRPPLKVSIVMDGPVQTLNNRNVESTINAMLETHHDRNDLKRSTITAQRNASNTSRTAAQFKSPLVNATLPADSCTIHLTPALQTLERKLQVLKRAVKVKEENEEVVLTRLAEKWIEAGREAAYDVWGATKDAGEFAENTTFNRRSHSWGRTNDRNASWGWDVKIRDPSEESCDVDPSEASCTTGRLAPEEEDVSHNTLGTMLRQLGVAPELFGWDDDKEAFSD